MRSFLFLKEVQVSELDMQFKIKNERNFYMNEEILKQLVDLYNMLYSVQSCGDDTLKIASCIMTLRNMLSNIQTVESKENIEEGQKE